MNTKKPINEGYQPLEKKGYQPQTDKFNPNNGYQPKTGELKPSAPPPKKP